jgi:hypothetical protein
MRWRHHAAKVGAGVAAAASPIASFADDSPSTAEVAAVAEVSKEADEVTKSGEKLDALLDQLTSSVAGDEVKSSAGPAAAEEATKSVGGKLDEIFGQLDQAGSQVGSGEVKPSTPLDALVDIIPQVTSYKSPDGYSPLLPLVAILAGSAIAGIIAFILVKSADPGEAYEEWANAGESDEVLLLRNEELDAYLAREGTSLEKESPQISGDNTEDYPGPDVDIQDQTPDKMCPLM